MSVFVDTWAWFALTDPDSSDHALAELAFRDMRERRVELVTKNFVLAEATTLIRYKIHHAAAVGIRRLTSNLVSDHVRRISRLSEAQEQEAGEVFDRYDRMDLSFTDCTSFAIMRQRSITEALTGDAHFEQAGFVAAMK